MVRSLGTKLYLTEAPEQSLQHILLCVQNGEINASLFSLFSSYSKRWQKVPQNLILSRYHLILLPLNPLYYAAFPSFLDCRSLREQLRQTVSRIFSPKCTFHPSPALQKPKHHRQLFLGGKLELLATCSTSPASHLPLIPALNSLGFVLFCFNLSDTSLNRAKAVKHRTPQLCEFSFLLMMWSRLTASQNVWGKGTGESSGQQTWPEARGTVPTAIPAAPPVAMASCTSLFSVETFHWLEDWISCLLAYQH